MNRMDAIVSRAGTWRDAASLFDEPASDAPRPVLENERPRTCQDCGATFLPSKGASRERCASCKGREANQRRQTAGRFGIARQV